MTVSKLVCELLSCMFVRKQGVCELLSPTIYIYTTLPAKVQTNFSISLFLPYFSFPLLSTNTYSSTICFHKNGIPVSITLPKCHFLSLFNLKFYSFLTGKISFSLNYNLSSTFFLIILIGYFIFFTAF